MKLAHITVHNSFAKGVCDIINRNGFADYVIQLDGPGPQLRSLPPDMCTTDVFVRVPDDMIVPSDLYV